LGRDFSIIENMIIKSLSLIKGEGRVRVSYNDEGNRGWVNPK